LPAVLQASKLAAVRKNPRPASHAMQRACAHCSAAAASLRACSSCGCVRYCGAECQRAAWKAHKASCRAAAALQSLLDAPSVIGSSAALRAALAPHAASPASLAPFAQARLFLLRAIFAEQEAATGDPLIAHDAHAAAFAVIARCPAALQEAVSVGGGGAPTRQRILDVVADATLMNWVLSCTRFCLNSAGGGAPRPLPPAPLAVLRALAFDDAQPAFVQLLACWTVACSGQFGGHDGADEPTHMHLTPDATHSIHNTVMVEVRGAPSLEERILCHARMEALGAAARQQMPAYLKGHIDMAVGEARAFNANVRRAGEAGVDVLLTGGGLDAEA
jgi:hypothetical protein